MTESKSERDEPVMGRADILLKFLQLVKMDRPEDIEPFLKELDADTERRPLADQLVDLIIAGDEKLYEEYERARKYIGPRNPYSSLEPSETEASQEQALGSFLSKWITFESLVRQRWNKDHKDVVEYAGPLLHLVRDLYGSSRKQSQQIDYLRRLRNQAVHGIDPPNTETLTEAGEMLDQLLAELKNEQPTEPIGKRRGRQ